MQGSEEIFPEMVGIFDTNDNFALGMATDELNNAGIVHEVVRVPNLSLNTSPANPKWWIPPCRILVAREDEQEASALIEPLEHALDLARGA